MKHIIKFPFLMIFSLSFCFITYKLCYSLAEKYFFDKFFFNKSAKYGYWSKNQTYEKFGDRAKDIIALINTDSRILGTTNDHRFKIAFIGDSFVWGQGVKTYQTVVSLLQNRLNKIKPNDSPRTPLRSARGFIT